MNWAGVLLAAGASERLGQPKQMIQYKGQPLLLRTLQVLAAMKPETLIVVTGAATDAITNLLDGQACKAVYNPNWRNGMGTSLAAAARHLQLEERRAQGVLVMLCDQWKIDVADIRKLLDTWAPGPEQLVVSTWTGKSGPIQGPPAIFPSDCIGELARLEGDEGARPIVRRHRSRLVRVDMPHAAADLDTPADLVTFQQSITECND